MTRERGKLHEAKEVLRIKLAADKNAAPPLNPGKERFGQPAPGYRRSRRPSCVAHLRLRDGSGRPTLVFNAAPLTSSPTFVAHGNTDRAPSAHRRLRRTAADVFEQQQSDYEAGFDAELRPIRHRIILRSNRKSKNEIASFRALRWQTLAISKLPPPKSDWQSTAYELFTTSGM
jgi:hypothetical protein